MDAKVLKAAVSAAIRVTVSTTLIGCGGQMSTDAGTSGGPTTGGPASSSGQTGATKSSGAQPSVGYPKSQPATAGTATDTSTGGSESTAGSGSTGGVSVGGMASEAGAANGGEPNGDTPLDNCACKALLENVKDGDVLSNDAKVCCQAAIDNYLQRPATEEQCSIFSDWFSLPAHQQCCTALNAWQEPACTPWGPPVPPELSSDALLEWEAAA